jgi:excisionase family DNA binding protein
MAVESERLLTVREVAERLRVHPITVRRLIASGRLAAVRIGRAVRVREADVGALSRPGESRARAAYRRPPAPEEMERRRKVGEEMLKYRAEMKPLSMSTTELIRQERRMLARKHDRWRKPFDEMRKLRDQMEPMDISTAELVRLARSVREWMYKDDDE